ALASSDLAVDALFRQTGVIRVDTMEQLFQTAAVLAHQPLPAGRRVAIVGNSGGPGVLAADACEAVGLDVPELSPATQQALRACLPPAAGVRNPVDMTAAAEPATCQQGLRILLADAGVDAVMAVCTPTLVTSLETMAAAIAEVGAEPWDKPLVANLIGTEGIPEVMRGRRAVPSFPFPETAAQALARAAWYAEWRRRPPGTVRQLDGIDLRTPRRLVEEFLAAAPGGGWLDPVVAGRVLDGFGIPIASEQLCAGIGVETIAGVERDPAFGPVIMFGLGGIAAELVGDRAVRVAPLTDQDAAELVRSLRSSPLLFGYRNSAPTDVAAIEDLLLRLSVLGQQLPEIAELDLNPVIAGPDGVVATGWRIRVTPAERHPERDLRRLR
ncbi:MAG TPA: acetate--CoA ligase family protein, partial [Acidimicrobiia bacterium]|nr:acetate--CoA ligase family protein [Acidimicrobiia bacterium]